MRRLSLIAVLIASPALAAAFAPEIGTGGASRPITLTIERTPGAIDIRGDSSSTAHEVILRRAVSRFFADDTARIALSAGAPTPPGWALITEMVVRALGSTVSATATVSGTGVAVRGITTTPEEWAAAAQKIVAALPDGLSSRFDVTAVRSDISYAELCQNRFREIVGNGRVEFSPSGAELRSSAYPLLDAIVEVAIDCPDTVLRITGHTDDSGSEDTDRAVSEARALSVRDYLTGRGLPRDRVEATGAGASSPLAANSDARSRQLNRRIDLELLPR